MDQSVSEVVIRDDENEVVTWETQKLDIHCPPGGGSKFGQFCVNLQSWLNEKLRSTVTFSGKVSSSIELESKVVGLMFNQLGDKRQPQRMQHIE